MSTQHTLAAEPRAVTGKKVKYLRQEGVMPATVYGKNVEPVSIQVDERAFELLYREVGNVRPFALAISGAATHTTRIHDIQRHPVSRTIIHADFFVVEGEN